MANGEKKIAEEMEKIRTVIANIAKIDTDTKTLKEKWEAYQNIVPIKQDSSDQVTEILKVLMSDDYMQTDNNIRVFKEAGLRVFSSSGVSTDKLVKFGNKYIELLAAIKNDDKFKDINKNPPTTYNPPSSQNNTSSNFDDVTKFILEVYQANQQSTSGKYSEEEKQRIRNYVNYSQSSKSGLQEFQESMNALKKNIMDNYNASEITILDIAKKYSASDTRVKKDVLEKLMPTDISKPKEVDIVSKLESIVQQISADNERMKGKFTVARRGGRRAMRGGTVSETTKRDAINRAFEELIGNIDKFKKICETLYKNISRFTSTDKGNISNKGEDSIFNKLYETYLIEKEGKVGTNDFIASNNLINNLKANDVYPDIVLEIDMRDKFVFIAATLFMRIIAIMIIDLIVNRKLVTRMDTALFWYGVTFSSILILFVLMVNYDSYKLRVIFNYVNFHIGYTNFLAYITQLWIFGGMVYYIMLNINDSIITSATNDEERDRLKHKVQVVSMITWIFLSIGVLIM
jgi:hypothetical protein